MTSNLALATAPGNVQVSLQETGLSKDSVVNVSQVVTVDKKLLRDFVSTLPAPKMKKVDEGLRLILNL